MKCEVPKIVDSNFETCNSTFYEYCCFKSNLNGNVFQNKCFIIFGFNIPEEDSFHYFISNWQELTGLGNLLSFLTPTYFVNRVSLLVNSIFKHYQNGQFHFMLVVEIFFNEFDLIYLLDFVQQFRVKRNLGFISVYAEYPATKQEDCHTDVQN